MKPIYQKQASEKDPVLAQSQNGSNHNEGFEEAAGVDIRTDVTERHRSRHETWYRWLFRQMCLPEQTRILELGSGPGDLWVENWERVPAGWQIVASDLSAGMVREGMQRIGSFSGPKTAPGPLRNDQFQFAIFDTDRLPFETGLWDVVLAFGLLDLVADVQRVLAEIWRVLKPGGRFYTSAGGRHHLVELEALLSPFGTGFQIGGNPAQFGLDNGARRLASCFENIILARYHDDLVFKTVEPIMAYILSENEVEEQLTAENQLLLERCLTELLAEWGEIRITAEKGVFTSQKPRPHKPHESRQPPGSAPPS